MGSLWILPHETQLDNIKEIDNVLYWVSFNDVTYRMRTEKEINNETNIALYAFNEGLQHELPLVIPCVIVLQSFLLSSLFSFYFLNLGYTLAYVTRATLPAE